MNTAADPGHREFVVKVKLTGQEKENLDQMCRSCGLSRSGYIRMILFTRKVNIQKPPGEADEALLEKISQLVTEFSRTGNNLNQIARHLNSGGGFSEDTVSVLRNSYGELAELKHELLKLLGGFYGNHKAHRL